MTHWGTRSNELLRHIRGRVKMIIQKHAAVECLPCNESALLQFESDDPAAANAHAARIVEGPDGACLVDANDIRVKASAEICSSLPGLHGPEAMIEQKDLAPCRTRKKDGRNCLRIHTVGFGRKIWRRVAIGEEFRAAIGRRELQLHYQPQFDIDSGRIVGLEALARWNHPTRGLVSPAEFIPIAERTGAIVPLGKWALEETCRQVKRWQDAEIAPRSVAVNLSAAQCKRREFERDLADCLTKSGVDASRIELELTESALMEVTQQHCEIIQRLRSLGVKIAIDDFGTGYSSLSYLTAYPVDRIKIARELVFLVASDCRHAAVVRAVIRLAEELQIEVIAEGVEDIAQARFLASAGCGLAQGYYYGPPVNAEYTTQLLSLQNAAPPSNSIAQSH